MGAILSRFSSETYYANYEKAFSKLETTQHAIQKRTNLRQHRRKTLSRALLSIGVALTLCTTVYASWVYQRELGTFSAKGRALRLSLVWAMPCVLALVHYILLIFFDALHRWDARQLQKLQKSMDTMLQDLKDRNRYSKIQELLQKYDPEERQKQALLEKLKTAPQSPGAEPSVEAKRSGTIGSSLMFGAGKLIDSVANRIIGDQPELLAEIEKLRGVLHELEQKNAALQQENAILKRQFGAPPPDVTSPITSHRSETEGESAE